MKTDPKSLPAASTPQFRTLLLRRLKNLFPEYESTIATTEDGTTFSLHDGQGRDVTKAIKIYRHQSDLIRGQALRQIVESNRI